MTKDEALAAAERVLSLVNSRPWTPTREEVAEAIGYVHQPENWVVMACTELQRMYMDLSEIARLQEEERRYRPEGLSRLKPSEMIQSEEF